MSDIDTNKSFMENYLPREILSIINLDNSVLEKDNHTDKN